MASEHHFKSGESAIWLQPAGPGTDMEFLGCHAIDSIDIPLGDYEPFYCPDPAQPNTFTPAGENISPPGALTLSIVEDVTNSLSLLKEQKCPFALYINLVRCGRKDVFSNADITWIIDARRITNRSISNVASRDSSDRMERSYDISGVGPEIEVQPVAVQFLTTTETEPLNFIASCNTERCAGSCGNALTPCQYLFAGADGQVAATANVLFSTDAGVTWAAGAADPFAVAEDIITGTCFSTGTNTRRHLVARGVEAAPANPAEVAYTDNAGTSWTTVNVEAAPLQHYATGANALFSLDEKHIWFGTNGGYIYFSEDGGASWVNQTAGTVTTENVNCIHFANFYDGFAACENGIILKTEDGGLTWTACTAVAGTPDLDAIHCFDEDTFIVGDRVGVIRKSSDGGVTYTTQYTNAANAINAISFANAYVGYAVADDEVIRTRNGGENWEVITTAANTEIKDIVACSTNLAYGAGETTGNAALLLKASA